jgi:tetratricopeptide (TPR) repeat protein
MKKLKLYLLLTLAIFAAAGAVRAQEETRKAAELSIRGDFKGAIEMLDKSIAKNKDLYAAYKLRASLKRMTGDFKGAADDYTKAIEQKQDDGELYEQRAMMRLFTRQDTELILKDLDAAITYGRKVEKIYTTRAMIRLQLRDPEGAEADYRTAIGLRPDRPQAYIGLAGLYAMNREDDKAIQVLEVFIDQIENSGRKIPKSDGEAVLSTTVDVPAMSDDKTQLKQSSMLISGTRLTGGAPTAEEMNKMTEKLETAKNTAAAYANLAAIYERKKDYEKASVLVEKALKIDAQEFPAYETRGKIKTEKGDYGGAIDDFSTALKLMPNMPTAYLNRGIAKLLAGRAEEAQKDFDKYLQMFPNGKAFLDRRISEAKEKMPQ